MSEKIRHGFIWKLLQQYSSYFVKIIVQTILARMLSPDDFGMIAIVMAFISIADIIAISGFGTALVQKKEPEDADFSTTFVYSMCVSCVLYAALYFAAPFLSAYYRIMELSGVLRLQGVMIFIQSLASVQNAYILKNFEIKKSFIATCVSLTAGGTAAVIAALCGAGVYALVILNIVSGLLSIVVLYILVPWKPEIRFELSRFCGLFSFSWKVLCASLSGTVLENMYNLSIGKLYGEAALGYYNRGNSYAGAVIGQSTSAMSSLFLPVCSGLQDHRKRLLGVIRKMTRLSAFFMCPVATGLFVVSDDLVKALLTEKWINSVFFLRLECVFYLALALSSPAGQGIVALGRSDISLRIEIVKMMAAAGVVFLFGRYGVRWLCVARAVLAVAGIMCSVMVCKRLTGYRTYMLLEDISRPFLLSAVMGTIVWQLDGLPFGHFLTLAVRCVLGVFIYTCLAVLWMRDDIKTITGRMLET